MGPEKLALEAERSQQIEEVFRRIQLERMCGVPVINPALEVEIIGLVPWASSWLGVLLTPWFMNLLLVPQEVGAWESLSPGTKILHRFPSGPYEFIVAETEGMGRYQTCSLFSPVFEFRDQKSAIATAKAVMEALLEEEHREVLSSMNQKLAPKWQQNASPNEEEVDRELPNKPPKSLSRRALLRGDFLDPVDT